MEIVTPGIGLIFWSSIVFILLLVLLRKYAWKPILTTVQKREDTIKESLASAEAARKEMQNLKADNERILSQARQERDGLLAEARKMKDNILSQAKDEAKKEGTKIIIQAKATIAKEKEEAIKELKNQVADISLQIAEKVLGEELSEENKQHEKIQTLVKQISLN